MLHRSRDSGECEIVGAMLAGPDRTRSPHGNAAAARLALWICLSVCASGCGGQLAPPDAVVLIVVDTLRADHLGTYGYLRPTSPGLDRWAKRGVVFERAWAPSPWTLPSFASLYTGRLPTRHGAGVKPGPGGDRKFSRLARGVPVAAEIIGARGFATAGFATNRFLQPGFGVERGFQTYDVAHGQRGGQRRADVIVDRALAWIDDRGSGRFFASIHILDPHMPYDAPAPARGRFTDGLTPTPGLPLANTQKMWGLAAQLSSPDRAYVSASYDEEVAFVDLHLTRLLEQLEARGILSRALVMLTSDHGEELFDRGGFEHGHSLYQELLHVPLVIWGPDLRPARIATPVSLVDLLPTLLDALDLPQPDGLDGVSLWPAVRAGAEPPHRDLFAQSTLYGPPRRAVIAWPYKLILDAESGRRQLYDLSVDPGEKRDLAPARAGLAEELAEVITSRLSAPAPREAVELDPQTLEELRELGYLR
jgi:arylsulfatase A-like enzyme